MSCQIRRSLFLNRWSNLARHWLPQCCVLCGAAGGDEQICGPCDAELPRLARSRCAVCALPLASEARNEGVCGACLDSPPRYARVLAPFRYEYPLDAVIRAYKYGGRLAYSRLFGAALAAVATRDADAIVAMPLSPARLAERGFNQALEIARVVADATGIPLLPFACRRVVDTPPQAALPWKERAKNVRRAFVCDADLTGRRVAVVDDVLTTGATLNELARVLRKAGRSGGAGLGGRSDAAAVAATGQGKRSGRTLFTCSPSQAPCRFERSIHAPPDARFACTCPRLCYRADTETSLSSQLRR
jgi:ComF family protein